MQCDIQRLTQQQHQQQNTYHPHHQAPSHTIVQQPAPSHTILQQPVALHSFASSAATQQPITMNYYHPNQSPQPPAQVYQPVISCDIGKLLIPFIYFLNVNWGLLMVILLLAIGVRKKSRLSFNV